MFTDYQKRLVKLIVDKKITNLYDFNSIECKDDYDVVEWNNKESLIISHIPKNKDLLRNKYIEFISLLNILSDNKYIDIINSSHDKVIISIKSVSYYEDTFGNPPRTIENVMYPYDKDFIQIYEKYQNKTFFPLQFLHDLVKRNYRTFEEEKYYSERRSRITWQIITLAISIISMLSTIGTTVFKEINSNKEQNKIMKRIDDKLFLSNKVEIIKTNNGYEVKL
jgi:hypothetical protein